MKINIILLSVLLICPAVFAKKPPFIMKEAALITEVQRDDQSAILVIIRKRMPLTPALQFNWYIDKALCGQTNGDNGWFAIKQPAGEHWVQAQPHTVKGIFRTYRLKLQAGKIYVLSCLSTTGGPIIFSKKDSKEFADFLADKPVHLEIDSTRISEVKLPEANEFDKGINEYLEDLKKGNAAATDLETYEGF